MRTDNVLLDKSKSFAIRIIRLYKYLREKKKEYILADQILRSGTSIGSNSRESRRAEGIKDFVHKLNIALKEADETAYWLELLIATDYISEKEFESLYIDCEELIKLLTSIINTAKRNNNSKF